jgi:hypothetical protein
MQLDPAFLAPEAHGFAGHCRAVIKSQRMWPTTAVDALIEPPRHSDAGDATIHQLPDTQARVVVDNVQAPDPPTASQADHGRCLLTSARLGAVATSSPEAVVPAFFAAGCGPACPARYTVDPCAAYFAPDPQRGAGCATANSHSAHTVRRAPAAAPSERLAGRMA